MNTAILENNVQGAFLTLNDSFEVLTIASEISCSRAILVAERHEIPENADTGQIRFGGETRLAKVIGRRIVEENYVELEFEWQSAPINSSRHVIFVRPDLESQIALEQIRDDGQSRVSVTEDELRTIIEFLSFVGKTFRDAKLELDDGLQIQRWQRDESFSIRRNQNLILGQGDIRFYLHPV